MDDTKHLCRLSKNSAVYLITKLTDLKNIQL